MKKRIGVPHWAVIVGVLMVLLGNGCVFEGKYEGIAPGPWRGALLLDGRYNQRANQPQKKYSFEIEKVQFEEVAEGELPFVMEVIHPTPDSFYIEIINGDERVVIPADHISYGKDRTSGDDTIRIDFPHYDAYITAKYEATVIEGDYVDRSREGYYTIPFVAKQGQDYRFSQLRKPPVMDVSGRWEVTFGIGEEEPEAAIGEFKQDGNYLTGTFLTETGDYRYLEGTVQDNKLYLSTFDGTHAYLFEAKIMEDSTLIGSFRSGNHYRTLWEAKRNPDAQLRDAYSLTYLKDGYDRLTFAFPDVNGQLVSIDDPAYVDKVRIVQILGTWCPNCMDETNFLVDYLKRNPSEDLAVIGLAYERRDDMAGAVNAVRGFKNRLNVPYPILIAGSDAKAEAAKTLPMLNAIISFPTMIVIDKAGKVRKIHTGFSGPATSAYQPFKAEFEALMKQLLAE